MRASGLEIAGQVLLIDPWLDGNPLFPTEKREDLLEGVDRDPRSPMAISTMSRACRSLRASWACRSTGSPT
jgi:hypothetical protein